MIEGLVVDLFAGGGGATEAIEQVIGRPVDVALNHNPVAIAMHKENHPETRHYIEDVWAVDPRKIADGRQIGLAWFSPDCKHFSRAKGDIPLEKKIRALAWVVVKYAKMVKPKLIFLENVIEFEDWGPLKWDGRKKRWVVDKKRKGEIFKKWVGKLEKHGYVVEWKHMVASDFGAPTSRKRLFLVARCDGEPIVWPETTHGADKIPYRSAYECIDWSIDTPSIFTRKTPLVDNTMRRIHRGLKKFVIDEPNPFIISYYGPKNADAEFRGRGLDEPLPTQTTENRFGLVIPYVVKHFGGAIGSPIAKPLPTILGRNTQNQLLAVFVARQFGKSVGSDIRHPAPTTTAGGSGKTQLAVSHLIKLRGDNIGNDLRDPTPTITAGGLHIGEVRTLLQSFDGDPNALGIIKIHGEDYQIVDIGMRMFQPRELFTAQGFRSSYIIDFDYNGKPLTKSNQVMMVGNSVSPHPAKALVEANILRKAA